MNGIIEPKTEHRYTNKFILSKELGYNCGLVGVDVPNSGWYILRPCNNSMRHSLSAQKVWIEKSTNDLPIDHFWCEWFTGHHVSTDYWYGIPDLTVIGIRNEYTKSLKKWLYWKELHHHKGFPLILDPIREKYEWINCKFIGRKLIKVQFKRNPDFRWGNTHFYPVWEEPTHFDRPGWEYVECPDEHGRVGAWIYPHSKKP